MSEHFKIKTVPTLQNASWLEPSRRNRCGGGDKGAEKRVWWAAAELSAFKTIEQLLKRELSTRDNPALEGSSSGNAEGRNYGDRCSGDEDHDPNCEQRRGGDASDDRTRYNSLR